MFQLGRPISLTIYVEYRQHSDSLTQFQLADGALLPTVAGCGLVDGNVCNVHFVSRSQCGEMLKQSKQGRPC